MLSSTFNKIEARVLSLLKECKILSLPIPIEIIARSQKVDVIPYELGDEVSGMLVINKDSGVIGYNSKHSKGRQRFTIAHEFGHYILHRNLKELFVDKDFIVIKYRSNKEYSALEMKHEREANAFAASILMPEYLIRAEIEKKAMKMLTENELIEKLANIFEVSVPAMTFRLSEVNLYNG